ncbi:hypothetical protein GA0115233_104329 [Streptomyces sp. DI166]|nr:hypothetical protein GA0115233_104329 [Streptomyces sp. DI166]
MAPDPSTPEPMADDTYQPTGGNEEQEDATPLDPENTVGEPSYDDVLDAGYSPPEHPLGVTEYGTTAAEQHQGESLDERLAREAPEGSGAVEEDETGSAEEAAVHIVGEGTA